MSANVVSTAPGRTASRRLLEVLDLEQVAQDRFIGHSPDPGAVRVFGGQLATQAALAAAHCVPEDRRLVTLQSTFVRMGNASEPIEYRVEMLGDGRTFAFRRVVASQGERLLFSALVTFHAGDDGPAHEWASEEYAAPEDLSVFEPAFGAMLTEAFDLRRRINAGPGDGRSLDLAVRTTGALPDDPHLHAALVVYASFMFILDASLLPHQAEPDVFAEYGVATVDHAIHLHLPVRSDDWVVSRFGSPRAGAGLSELRCQMRTADGTLVASALQHGLLVHDRRGIRG